MSIRKGDRTPQADRRAGVLLHPTSLPGPYGVGDLGPQAKRWVDFLAAAGQSVWQVLPLGPTGYGDSPYQCFSVFAGNPRLISPDLLVEENLISPEEAADHPAFESGAADFNGALAYKLRILRKANERHVLREELRAFREAEGKWLENYALFIALKRAHDNHPWWEWERDLVLCRPAALQKARADCAAVIDEVVFQQFLFFRQWEALRRYAHERGLRIIGDVPLYTALDGADVWFHKEYFSLDEEGRPLEVAGVPPDYFSATGQLWGNPVFRWDRMRQERFAWWVDRMRCALRLCDLVRLDHFRGYQAYWSVPADRSTAEVGSWMPGPGAALFARLRTELGRLPFIAEDLGVITAEVDSLREEFALPGMRVLQFAFGDDADNPFLPHNFQPHTVVYTGTHDNDTTRGWFASLPEKERDRVRRYLARDGSDIAWDLIRLAWSSVGETAVAPLQDVLNLGGEARMNYPGRPTGNWAWRFREEDLRPELAERLREMSELYGRIPSSAESASDGAA